MSDNINIVIADKNFDTKVLNGLLVKSEMNANTINIEFPKVYEMESLENKIFVIKTINANGVYFEEILPKTISENKIVLTWKIGSEYTSVGGLLKVAIFAEGGNYALGTKTSKIIVESSPQFTAPISPEYVFEKYLKEIRVHAESASNSAEQSLKILTNMNSKIVDDFASTEKDKALSANKGRELNNRINNIVGQAGTSNTEIVDARNSPERNVIYPTLKARLDAVDGDIVKSKYSTPATATAPIITLPSTAVQGKLEGSLKGNTLYNAVTNGDFSKGTSGWSAISATLNVTTNNTLVVTGNGASVSARCVKSSILKSNTRYFLKLRARVTNESCTSLRLGTELTSIITITEPIKDRWYDMFALFTSSTDKDLRPQHIYTDSTAANGKVMEVDGNVGVFTIPITGTPYENWTADQLNNLMQGYWEGLGSSNPTKAKSVGKNLFDISKSVIGNLNESGVIIASGGLSTSGFIKVKPNTTYRKSVNQANLSSSARHCFYDINKNFISFELTNGLANVPSNAHYMRVSYADARSANPHLPLMLNEGNLPLPYEPYTETELFAPVELGRVPNGVVDEFTFDGIYTQRTKETNVDLTAIADQANIALAFTGAFLDNSPFVRPINPNIVIGGKEQIAYISSQQVDDIANIGKYYTMDNQRLYFIFAKGTTLEQAKLALAGTKARYQIANPIETQYPASNLISEPSGTVYVESAIKVVKPYTTNIVLDVKIKNLISINKVGGETRVPVLPSLVNISTDGMSLTILNSSSGDMYELEYETFGATLPTMEYSYPLNLNAQVQGNTEGLKDIDQTLKDFLAYQNAVNAQVDLRLVLLERK